jgi:hypothetical protein
MPLASLYCIAARGCCGACPNWPVPPPIRPFIEPQDESFSAADDDEEDLTPRPEEENGRFLRGGRKKMESAIPFSLSLLRSSLNIADAMHARQADIRTCANLYI